MRRPEPRLPAVVALLAATAGAGTTGLAAAHDGRSTVEHTIRGEDRAKGFSMLRSGPGEAYVVRDDGVGTARPGREARRRSLIYLAQLTDFQLVDEESPARVETLDPRGAPFESAFRPQEALVPHMVDQTVRQVNRFLTSPLRDGRGRRAAMALTVITGDNADNMQLNETEAVVRILEGGRVDPNSGSADAAAYLACPPGTPGPTEGARYTGVQDRDDGFASDHFYDPDAPSGPNADWPRWPGLLDRAQQPFDAEGLRVPFYALFGNHDALVQGNQHAVQAFEQAATGCTKQGPDNSTVLVPPDPRRRFVARPEYKQLFATGSQPDGHGFGLVDAGELRASRGAASYYAWTPVPGLRFIALDTIADAGIALNSSAGNLDHPQFLWLERELRAASARGELIVLLAHHAPQSMTANVPDEAAVACTTEDAHGHDVNPGCDLDPRPSEPIHLGPDLVRLLHRFPHVIALVAGHSHLNDVAAFRRSPDGEGGFWAVRTPAVIDWPHQHRLLELFDNRDGTLSLFGTVLDHAGPVEAPAAGTPGADLSPEQLAATGRTIGYNDPQKGGGSGEGSLDDRNVELLIRDPRRAPAQVARPLLRVRVTPQRARVGRRTTFRFRVTAQGRPVRRALVLFAGKGVRTNARGRARRTVTLRRSRSYRVVVMSRGAQRTTARVVATRRR